MSDNNKIIGYENQSFPQGLWIIEKGIDRYLLSNIKYNLTFKDVKKFCEDNSIDIKNCKLYRAPDFVKQYLTDYNFKPFLNNSSLFISYDKNTSTSADAHFIDNSKLGKIEDLNEHLKNNINIRNIENYNEGSIYDNISESGDDFICIKVYNDDNNDDNKNKVISEKENGTIEFNSNINNESLTLIKINITSRNFDISKLSVYKSLTFENKYCLIHLANLEGEPKNEVYGDPLEQSEDTLKGEPWKRCTIGDQETELNLRNLLEIDKNANEIKVYKQYTEYKLNRNL